jgi:hypothetical protein
MCLCRGGEGNVLQLELLFLGLLLLQQLLTLELLLELLVKKLLLLHSLRNDGCDLGGFDVEFATDVFNTAVFEVGGGGIDGLLGDPANSLLDWMHRILGLERHEQK